jgi:transcriptional regulator NrdR family protein
MWCAGCRGTYLAVRRLLPDLRVIDPRRSRQESPFDADKLRMSLAEPLRKRAGEGLRDPSTLDLLPPLLQPLAAELVFDFVAEHVSRVAAEPNGKVTTDEIAAIAMAGLFNTHELAFLRSAVHHRMLAVEATEQEWEELAEIASQLAADTHAHTQGSDPVWPALREPAPAILCPRCGSPRVARRSRASVVRGLDQQAASCSNCGQRFVWEWGSRVPLLITSRREESLFDPLRFRAGIRHSVRKLPGPASIWSDERLVGSAASSALASATPYIRTPQPGQPLPSIDASDLWLAAASALRGIHPLAYVRYTLHSGGVGALDWRARDNAQRLARMLDIVQGIGRRYFKSRTFPAVET